MNSSLNVLTSFLIGESYSLADKNQLEIALITRDIMSSIEGFVRLIAWAEFFPDFAIQRGWHRKIMTWLIPGKQFFLV